MPQINRLKILHITAWYPTEDRPANGIFVREHIRAAALNHDCTVWAFYDHPDFATPKFEILESSEYGLKTVRTFLPFGGLPKIRYLLRLRTLLKFGAGMIKRERPDVIHAHTFHAAVPTVILGRRFGIPAVMTEHWSGFQQGLLNRTDKIKLLYALRRVKVVMPVSSFLADIMKGYGVAADFEVVPNVVDGEVFYPPPEPVVRGDGPIKLLAVSSLNPRKGIPILLNAMRNLKDSGAQFHLTIDGDGPNRAEYEKLAGELGLKGEVTFLGYLPLKSDIADLMRTHHIFVHSALDETFSVVTAEALCCGMPAVVPNIPPLPDLVNETNGLLVKPRDPAALADGIRTMIANLERYDRKVIATAAAGKYDHATVGRRLDTIYRRVISANK